MTTRSIQYRLSVTGEMAVLRVSISEDGEEVCAAEWEQDQADLAMFNTVYRRTQQCLPSTICLKTTRVYTAEDDGFATAGDPFDTSEDWLEYVDDEASTQFWCLLFDLSDEVIGSGRTILSAFIEFQILTPLNPAMFHASVEDPLPSDAPETGIGSGAEPVPVLQRITIDVRSLLVDRQSLGDVSSLPVLIEITPLGGSDDVCRVASSRHATATKPRLIVVVA